MDREVALSALLVFLLAAILFTCWLHACGRWRSENSAEYDLHSSAEVDDQEIEARKGARRKGLDKAALEALPTFVFSAPSGGSANGDGHSRCKQSVECPVCLSEFQDQEKGRLLPNCKHSFHVDCIDTWLLASGTCPVCRASCRLDVALEVEAETEAPPTSSSLGGAGGVQYPTNVLFWGSNSVHVRSSGGSNSSSGNVITIHIITPAPPPLLVADAAPSSSLPGPPSSHISRLNSLRRLLSRERMSSTSLAKL